jgi:hypothetical protein
MRIGGGKGPEDKVEGRLRTHRMRGGEDECSKDVRGGGGYSRVQRIRGGASHCPQDKGRMGLQLRWYW